ncbi:MAG: sulfite exporter TauE/SafE family protein [Candidatus Nanopelagicales bacterium]|jgi:uncharacterized membrane protein YfcA|nr:sulfite exporter TauE/SafE family protein [Candidatus Nanopelagicales bacterium]
MTLLLAAAVGMLLGAALGMFGGGGGILAVPMLVGLLGMDVDQAATASLVIVLFGAIGGLASHHRAGRVMWREGIIYGATSVVGTTLGALLAAQVADWVKLTAFTVLMVAAGIAMLRSARRQPATRGVAQANLVGAGAAPGDPGAVLIDIPAADVPAALGPGRAEDPDAGADPAAGAGAAAEAARRTSVPLLLLLATGTGLVTGFLGVGGGFLVVPALVLSLRMPIARATATGLVVIAIASITALVVRLTHSGAVSEPGLVALLVVAAVGSSMLAARFSGRLSPRALGTGFALLVLGMSGLVAAQAVAALP